MESFCSDRRDDIITCVFDEMGPGASEAFASHLASCGGCRDELESLRATIRIIADASAPHPADALSRAAMATAADGGDGISWEEEWTLLRRRLQSAEFFIPEASALPDPGPERKRAVLWLAWAASVAVIGALSFSAGLWRGVSLSAISGAALSAGAGSAGAGSEGSALPPVAGASIGNYFDNLDDFTRDTHNFLRRTRMVLMEFSNLGADSNPTFFRESGTELLGEVTRYQEVAKRMHDRKLGELLDRISGVLAVISRVDQANQKQVIADVKTTLNMTGLIATLDLLDAANGRNLKGRSNV